MNARPLLLVAGFLHATTTMLPAQTPKLDLTPVEADAGDGVVLRGERMLLAVPLVRSDPGSRTIHVEVHRFPATGDVAPGTPPVFVLNGGPGWPGLGPALRNRGVVRDQLLPMTRVADLVVVGQRGIGSSPPNTVCDALTPPPAGRETTPEGWAAAVREGSRRCRAKWEADGYDLRGFNVIEAAGDVADVRGALGYDRITLWGGSFGSHWAMAVMRFHPDIVARAVLSGLEGPDHTYDDPAGALGALSRIAEAAEADASLAPFIPEGGIIAGLRALLRRLEQEPLTVPIPHTDNTVRIDDRDVRGRIFGYSGGTSSRAGIHTWPADMLRLLHGDFSGIAPRVALGRRAYGGLPTASFFMLDCGSGITAERHARYTADPATAIVGHLGEFYDTACPAWDGDLGDAFRLGFATDIPTLLVHGTWDTSTPIENARELAPHFTRSRLVVVERGSHGALREAMEHSADFRDFVYRFAATGSLAGAPERVPLPVPDFAVPEGITR